MNSEQILHKAKSIAVKIKQAKIMQDSALKEVDDLVRELLKRELKSE